MVLVRVMVLVGVVVIANVMVYALVMVLDRDGARVLVFLCYSP